jgi:hypothetical protein
VATAQADHDQRIGIALRLAADCGQAYAETTDTGLTTGLVRTGNTRTVSSTRY